MIAEDFAVPHHSRGREARARAAIFGFLAEVLSSPPTQQALSALGALAQELGVTCDTGLSLGEVGQEYMELFVLPGPRYVAPYESVFRDEWPLPVVLQRGSNPSESGSKIKGLLMGESTMKVREWHLRAGILPQEDLPDHVANELRLLAWVSARRATAGPGEADFLLEFERKFCRDHFLKWIGELRERVAGRDRSGYYHAAVRMAECLVQEHADEPEQDDGPGVYDTGSAQRGGEQRETGIAARRCPFSETVSASLGIACGAGRPVSPNGRTP